jgi:hypothetical protein
MLNDAFKLTLDVIYPPVKGLVKTQEEPVITGIDSVKDLTNPQPEAFKVDGYADDHNMWGDSFYQFRSPL